MSEDSVNLIIALMKEQDAKRSAQIKGVHKNMEANFDAVSYQFKNIKDEFKIIKDDIHKITEVDKSQDVAIDKLKKETFVWRLVHKYPKVTLLLTIIFIFGVIGLLSYLNRSQVESIVKSLIVP